MKIIKIFLIISNFFNLIKASHDSFKNECGPYTGLEDEVMMPKKEDCLNPDNDSDGLKCCYVEGEKDLLKRTSCILIENNSEKRIELIEELSEIATKLKVDCGVDKSFDSECGIDTNSVPDSVEDCRDGTLGDEKCCFVKIKSPQFNGKACRKFKSIDINTIGEAVVAAKTVGAELEVKCNFILLSINYSILLLFLLYII